MVKVKVCGITRVDDALLASDLGASAVGFVFWPRSPRYLAPAEAREIAARLPGDVAPVGVFVDPAADEVRQVVEEVGLAAVQLHGDEPPAFCRSLPYRVIKAVGVDGADATRAGAAAVPEEATVLLDARDPERRGGTGRTVDWEIAAGIATEGRVFLAGGLRAANARAAIHAVRPYGLDVSSGVESAPGRKDPALLRAFFDEVARA